MATPTVSATIRLPVALYDRLRREAAKRQTTMTEIVIEALEKELGTKCDKEEADSDNQRD